MSTAQNGVAPPFAPRDAAQRFERVLANIKAVIKGKDAVVRQAMTCWLAGGHVLFEDVPGTGKTILARALARSVNVTTRRVQFTPDLLPSDIVGTAIYSREKSKFVFMPGPIFTTVMLADEINRATPRTQSALLQAMAEGQCTAENTTYSLPAAFFVIATQNPVEQQGTFPLPEAQLDRFMMRISLGYPNRQAEMDIIKSQLLAHPIDTLNPVITEAEWQEVRHAARHVKVADETLRYALGLVEATRSHAKVALGGSPRATIALIRCGQAFALSLGEEFVKPDYIKQLAQPVLEHRVILTTKARLEQLPPKRVVEEIIATTPVPVRS